MTLLNMKFRHEVSIKYFLVSYTSNIILVLVFVKCEVMKLFSLKFFVGVQSHEVFIAHGA